MTRFLLVVALLACKKPPPSAREIERDRWNAAYSARQPETEASALLVEIVKGRAPGDALDIAMGQGRNALFLAKQGWRVTGIDVSDVALKQAKAAAEQRGFALQTVEADMLAWDYGQERWDLIALIYAGHDARLWPKLKAALKPGGVLVVEFFARDAVVRQGMVGIAPGELAPHFRDGFRVVMDDMIEDFSEWGGPRKTKIARFVVEKSPQR